MSRKTRKYKMTNTTIREGGCTMRKPEKSRKASDGVWGKRDQTKETVVEKAVWKVSFCIKRDS